MDVTLVAGSRPDLLKQTLESFQKHVFKYISIGDVFANIDLHGGTETERQQCIAIVLKFFPQATITTPSSSSFGSAVKYLWSLPRTGSFLHLEDDWIATRDIRIDQCDFPQNVRTKQWFLVKPQVSQSILTSYRFRPVANIPFFLPNLFSPAFTTSPSVLDSGFAHRVSRILMAELNPEKQMFNGLNPLLEEELKKFRSKALISWWEKPFINDIGREWQRARGIQVEIVDGVHGYRNLGKVD